jgi:hypothetical protein
MIVYECPYPGLAHMIVRGKALNDVACKNTYPHKIKNTGYKITAGASI